MMVKRNSSLHTLWMTLLLTATAIGSSASLALGQVERPQKDTVLRNDLLTVTYHGRSGTLDVVWSTGESLSGIYSGALLADGRSLATTDYAQHELVGPPTGTEAAVGQAAAHEYTFRSTDGGKPPILQHLWIYDRKPWLAIEAELGLDASQLGTRHFDTVMLKGPNSVQVSAGKLRVLHVPFDNDMWFRYDSMAVEDEPAEQLYTSDEVTAIYNNEDRHAIVIGSIAHDTWKTAIEVHARRGQIGSIAVYGGIASPAGVRTDTHDTVPHGLVHGPQVASPRVFIGASADWRDALEDYAQANAAVKPPLPWSAGPPRGWNSWAAYGAKINSRRYLASAAFLRDSLVPKGFGQNKVLYINLDVGWSNLDAVQLQDAVATIKAMHAEDGTRFEPGIYWTPFAYSSDDLDAYVEGTGMKYRYREILLRAPGGSLLPKLDDSLALDPSHPGTKARTAYYLQKFRELGFTYLKLDFLSHGALEGAHFDPQVQTGIEAYNLGMRQIVDQVGSQMFLSLSISPLFPSGYGHARRLSCDTKGHISGGDQSTEYMLNSLTYGWWADRRLYLADPDHVVLGEQADNGARSIVEGRSRLLSAIISGGMVLDSSSLADDPQARTFAEAVYKAPNLFALAQEGAFRPVEGESGDQAATAFVRPSPKGIYLALFNYSDHQTRTISVRLDRIDRGLASLPSVTVTDINSGEPLASAHGSVTLTLQPAESQLLELGRSPLP